MRVPLSWLKEFVDVPVSPEELAERLTMAGIAVDAVVPFGQGVKGVVVARLTEVRPHPNADRLRICVADTGTALYEVVTGAPNVFPGAVVPLGLEGARLANGMVIKRARFRGVDSCGMVCSEAELGLEERSAGIMILPPETPLGEDVATLLGFPDFVLELDLTPNRGDCLCVAGIAREVAALYGLPLKFPPVLPAGRETLSDLVEVEIAAPELCGRYAARVFKEVKIGPSPLWMQVRLRMAGMRPINNMVDITNYVMLELGQPLHAFDYETLRGRKIVVRRADAGERLVSLDEVLRELGPEDLVIADAERAVAIAGVMGGLDTEVTPATATVLLESANFNPQSIRRTARALGLRSEASLRFEKGVDIEGAVRAADRAAYLVKKTGIGQAVPGVADCYPGRPERRTVVVQPARVEAVLGTPVPRDEAVEWLGRLGFSVQKDGENWIVSVPTFRPDVSIEEDIVEEVARFYGYERIPATLLYGETTPGQRPATAAFLDQVSQFLTGLGFSEVITYSFINPASFDRLHLPEDDPHRRAVRLKNPISEDQSVLRTLLLPGLLDVLVRNLSRRVDNVAVYEVGKVFLPRDGGELPEEYLKLGLAVSGRKPRHWKGPAVEMDFFFLKGIVEALLRRLRVNEPAFLPLKDHPALHPGRAARIVTEGEELGVIGELHPEVQEAYGLPARAVVGEFSVEALLAARRPASYRDLPRFPGVLRDVAFIIPEEVPAAAVAEAIKTAGGKLLRELKLFDVYKGVQVPEGTRSLAFSLLFQAEDRTLTDEEVGTALEAIVRQLAEEYGAVLRGSLEEPRADVMP
ncbi:MAG: phenylalanine--tRNA ligase subunit beta [Bacillota bacterium]|nr:phenylalanine--tRNA ligase subunit beta [Thermoanaerobacteraceae bacterium]